LLALPDKEGGWATKCKYRRLGIGRILCIVWNDGRAAASYGGEGLKPEDLKKPHATSSDNTGDRSANEGCITGAFFYFLFFCGQRGVGALVLVLVRAGYY